MNFIPKSLRTDPLLVFQQPEMKKKLTPGALRCMSFCGVMYSVIVTLTIFLTSLIMVLPEVCPQPSEFWPRVLLLLFLLFGITSNFILVNQKRSYLSDTRYDRLPDPSWRKCLDCEHAIPPRAHHCPLCQHCVLQRDHHCFFTGSCVGFENQRYFIVFCFYCGVGSAYCLYLLQQYIVIVFLQHESISFIHFILPIAVVECLFKYMTIHLFYSIIIGYLCFISATGSLGIFLWQHVLIAFGTTTFEFSQGNWSPKKINLIKNVRSVFGPWYMLNFIAPMLCLKTPGNGIDGNSSKFV